MASNPPGVAALDRVEAILRNPEIYELAALIPQPSREKGGRSRDYPDYMYLVFEALISVYASARQVEAELSHKVVWKLIRRTVKKMFPDDESMRLPSRPMRRHHYLYGRNRYLSNPAVLAGLASLHRELAADQARELGLMDPEGPGSFTHPHLSRMLHADGKVVTPLYKGRLGEEWVDKKTGEIKQVRYEPDADLHFEGTGETAYGTKFVLVAARSEEVRGRIILDTEWVPEKGGEAKVAMGCFTRLRRLVPGALGVVYDTALRGVHHQTLLREHGWIPVNRVTAAVAGSKQPRRAEGRRVEKSVHVEDREVTLSDGSRRTLQLYARAGAMGIGELTDKGELDFVELRRIRTSRKQDGSGLFRWYNDYELPESYGGKTVTVRLYNNDEDAARKFNRTENVRPIPPSDPAFRGIYSRRSDSESINRGLEDTLYLNRAHSVGHARQHVNLLGYALMVNSLALYEHRQRQRLASAA
jgi:hypothetical protein